MLVEASLPVPACANATDELSASGTIATRILLYRFDCTGGPGDRKIAGTWCAAKASRDFIVGSPSTVCGGSVEGMVAVPELPGAPTFNSDRLAHAPDLMAGFPAACGL